MSNPQLRILNRLGERTRHGCRFPRLRGKHGGNVRMIAASAVCVAVVFFTGGVGVRDVLRLRVSVFPALNER